MNRRKQNLVIVYVVLACAVFIILFIAIASGGGGTHVPGTTPQGVTLTTIQTSQAVIPAGVEGNLSPTQQIAFNRLIQNSSTPPSVRVDNAVIRFSTMAVLVPDNRGSTSNEKALAFLQDYNDLFDISSPAQNLSLISTSIDDLGYQQVSFSQNVNSIPVYGSMIRVQINSSDEVTVVNGGYIPGTVTLQSPTISSQQAEALASQNLTLPADAIYLPTELIYFDDAVFSEGVSQPHLSWIVTITDSSGTEVITTIIDALTGEILRQYSNIIEFSVEIRDNHEKSYDAATSATLVMNQNGCLQGQNCDQDARDAQAYSIEYGDFLSVMFTRDSYDHSDATFSSYSHVTFPKQFFFCPDPKPNAAWVSSKASTFYSDGFPHSPDVVFHEWTHALISSEMTCWIGSGLCPGGQSGALNESYADVFGVLLDNGSENNNWRSNNWRITDWEMGEDIENQQVKVPFRDISNPTRFGYPVYMENFIKSSFPTCLNHYGYVHENSGIPSKAAYLLLQDGQQTFNSYTVKGIGPLKVAYIYYRTITEHLSSNASFRDAYDATILSCVELIGNHAISQEDCLQIENAFKAVNIVVPSPNITPTPPSIPRPTTSPTIVPPIFSSDTSTILIFDASDTMNGYDPSGVIKIEAAKRAGNNILDILEAERQAGSAGIQIGVVSFNAQASIRLDLTTDIQAGRTALQNLNASNRTAMPDGLQTGMGMLDNKTTGSKPIIILLSDGLPNVGLGGDMMMDGSQVKQQVLDLATQAAGESICIYTVGFGDPASGSIDENFLRSVAQASGCGTYYNAQNANQLANVYVQLRHASTGNILLSQSGNIAQGEQVAVGAINVPVNQSEMLYTLNWPGSQLEAVLIDPQGQQVTSNYQGASFSSSDYLASVIVQNPLDGQWQVQAIGVNVPEGTTIYNAVLSVRPNTTSPIVTMPTASGFPIALLIITVAGVAVVVYVLFTTTQRSRTKKAGTMTIPQPSGNAIFSMIGGQNVGQTVTLRDGLTIGRNRTADLCLTDVSVSRQHAVLRLLNGSWFIQDQGSKGGTFVNDQKVSASILKPGDHIRIGSTEFEFRS